MSNDNSCNHILIWSATIVKYRQRTTSKKLSKHLVTSPFTVTLQDDSSIPYGLSSISAENFAFSSIVTSATDSVCVDPSSVAETWNLSSPPTGCPFLSQETGLGLEIPTIRHTLSPSVISTSERGQAISQGRSANYKKIIVINERYLKVINA